MAVQEHGHKDFGRVEVVRGEMGLHNLLAFFWQACESTDAAWPGVLSSVLGRSESDDRTHAYIVRYSSGAIFTCSLCPRVGMLL